MNSWPPPLPRTEGRRGRLLKRELKTRMLNLETLVTRSSLVKLGSPIVIALALGMSFMRIALDRQIMILSAFGHLPRGFQLGLCIRSSLDLSQNPRKRQPGGFWRYKGACLVFHIIHVLPIASIYLFVYFSLCCFIRSSGEHLISNSCPFGPSFCCLLSLFTGEKSFVCFYIGYYCSL